MTPIHPFASLFGPSPFEPMQTHMRLVADCVAEVPGLLQALIDRNPANLAAHQENIFRLEQAADSLKNDLRSHLPKGLLMPVDRRDLLELLTLQDAIAGIAQDIAGLSMDRPMRVPADMAEPLMALGTRAVDACEQAHQLIEELDELLELGFSGREVTEVLAMIATLSEIEQDAETQRRALCRHLFAEEDRMPPVSVMFWYRLICWLGALARAAGQVGNRLHLFLAG